MSPESPVQNSAPVFAALGNALHLELLSQLVKGGAASTISLSPSLGVSRQAVDRHLHILQAAGVLTAKRNGRKVLFSPNQEQLHFTANCLAGLASGWQRRLATIKALAEN